MVGRYIPRGITTYQLEVGQKFNRWEVIGKPYILNHIAVCLFQCECGKRAIRRCFVVTSGKSYSCGCYAADISRTHGKSNTRIKRRWNNMIKRCYDKNCISYPNYGGRGITVSRRWRIFENFYEDMGEIPTGLTIERIDNNKGYSKENCRWATYSEQNLNKRKRNPK